MTTEEKLAYKSLNIRFLTVFLWVGEFLFTLNPKLVVVPLSGNKEKLKAGKVKEPLATKGAKWI